MIWQVCIDSPSQTLDETNSPIQPILGLEAERLIALWKVY